MRLDQQLAERWIKPGSRVLDLGCGDGELLVHMARQLDIDCYGLEIDEDKITAAIGRGLNIIQQDLDEGLGRFADQSFDAVVMAQALQAVKAPDQMLLRRLSRFPTLRTGRRVATLDFEEKCLSLTHYLICGTIRLIFICVRFVILKPFVMQMGLELLIDLLSTAISKAIFL
jgi:ubiquinone/menaquinone biosynthesis C-methylase UbiE